MEDNAAERKAKVDEYLETVQRYVVDGLDNSEKRRSCLTVLFLVFAGVDGLGRLVHSRAKASVVQRFKGFLPRLGQKYCDPDIQERLMKVRNALMHNVLHHAAFLSAMYTLSSTYHHLKTTPKGSIYVNTEVLYKDFCDAFEEVRRQFAQDKSLLDKADRRLKREWFDPSEDWGGATPPPPISFVR